MGEVLYGVDARKKVLKGMELLAKAVSVTLGPKGRNVFIDRKYGYPHATKDGVTVVREFKLDDAIENMGVSILKDVANETVELCGDGTTTATLLTYQIASNGQKAIDSGFNPVGLKIGIEKASKEIVRKLLLKSTEVEIGSKKQLEIATISANNDPIVGKLVSDALTAVGEFGTVSMEESTTSKTYVSVVEGMTSNYGFITDKFVNNPNNSFRMIGGTYVLVSSEKVMNLNAIVSIVKKVIETNSSLLIIASAFDETVAGFIIGNINRGLQACLVEVGGGDLNRDSYLEDFAIYCGAPVINNQMGVGIESINDLEQLGKVDYVDVTKSLTVVRGGAGIGEKVSDRKKILKEQMNNENSEFRKKQLMKRIATFEGGVATIYVGGEGEVVMKELKDRIDDSLHATIVALDEGYLPGGGTVLLQIANELKKEKHFTDQLIGDDEKRGFEVLLKSVECILDQILTNAGEDDKRGIISKVINSKFGTGWDAKNEKKCNLVRAGVVDPTKVIRVALEKSVAAASLFLMTECSMSIEMEQDLK